MGNGLIKTLNIFFTPRSLIELSNQKNKEDEKRISSLNPLVYGCKIHKTQEKIAERKAMAYLIEIGRILVYKDLLQEGAYFLQDKIL